MPTNLRCVGRDTNGIKCKVSVLALQADSKYKFWLHPLEEQSIVPAILLAWNMAKALKISEKELHSCIL